MIVNRQTIYYLRLFSDLILINAAFLTAAILAQSFDILMDRNRMFILEAILNFAWYFFSSTTNFYDDFTARLFTFQTVNIIKNIIVQVIISITFIFIVKEDLFTRNFIIYYSLFLFILVSLRSVLFRKVMKHLRKKGRNLRHVLIIGTGEVGKNFRELIRENPDFGYRVKGYLSRDNGNKDEILGTYDQLNDVLLSGIIDEVVIALPQEDYSLIDDIIKTCNRNAVRTHIIPDYFRFVSKRFRISMIGNFPIITSRNEPLEEVQWRAVKRIFDFTFSLFVSVFILSILFPLVALFTKLTSKGPVFFVQERVGAKNKKFKCYKFRTLKTQNLSLQKSFQPVTENDPRVTTLGKFLRKTNIDELPQFINVLNGDMSIVGPRPYPIPYDDRYGKIFEEIKLRHNVKPGITGWAQVHGLRGDVLDDEENKKLISKRIEYDLWYIENWTFWLDIQIILLTILQMIRGRRRTV
ncbi:MAG: undecaprenyl-phosphate glucose phosphotransferase [Ignavibacteriales bacterium]|nr:MAG: undecaprenyl-phosphate glucose phosphotransferase [Ignavibacteriales bacterium]